MWAADSGVMWAAIPLRCGPHFLFHRNRGPHDVIVARMKRNGEIGPVAGKRRWLIPGRCFPEIKGEQVATREISHAPIT